jgi:uncharacterized protein YjbI with pentapeptide repeats
MFAGNQTWRMGTRQRRRIQLPPQTDPADSIRSSFFDLAAEGKDAWNAWRRNRANKDVRVIFAGTDFSEALMDGIDFSGLKFGDNADFSGCKWRGVDFTGAVFGAEADFTGASFGDESFFSLATFGRFANFRGAAFGNTADFSKATFGAEASFVRAAFGYRAIFTDVAFRNGVSFTGATFGAEASFTGVAFRNGAFAGAAFGGVTDFSGATFGERAAFTGAAFTGVAIFTGVAFGAEARFENTVFKGCVEFARTAKEQLNKECEASADEKDKDDRIALKKRLEDGSGLDRFLAISFANARFNGRVDFSGRTFENDTNFNYARFCYPPVFEPKTNLARIDFTGAYIGIGRPGSFRLTCDTEVLLRLGAFRKDAQEKRDDDRERDLYIEERKAKLGIHLVQWFEDLKKASMIEWPLSAVALITRLLWIVVVVLCWALADYGRSFVRPAIWLALSVPFFYMLYAAILMPQAGTVDAAKFDAANFDRAVRMVALGNAVPFMGSLTSDAEVKKLLFCADDVAGKCLPIPPEKFQLLVSTQNLLSIILVFFIVLALRNYFRIK